MLTHATENEIDLAVRKQGMGRQPALNLVRQLCETLETQRVLYCHWKSTQAIDRSASGENDLDLLVRCTDAQVFTIILHQLGFKQAQASPEQAIPGVLDYYGYDQEAGKLIHAHVHYQLVLGDDMTKNYHLPIEKPFLESAVQTDLFKVPSPEFEWVVFIIRMVIKHCTWDAILSHLGALSKTEASELEYLRARVNQQQVQKILQDYLPFVNERLFNHCVEILQPGCLLWTRMAVAQRLLGVLQAHARRPQISDTLLKFWRRGKRLIYRRYFRCSIRKRLTSGGAVIAFVGGDGSGKSTAVEEVYAWLSRNFCSLKIHMGKPPQSPETIIIKGTMKMIRWLGSSLKQEWSFQGDKTDPSALLLYLWLLRRIFIARDRHRTYVKARRFAANGGLVICDRYPLSQIKLMDGPQADQISSRGKARPLVGFFAHLEKAYYQQITAPDLLIVLKIYPETAVKRRMDEGSSFVRDRCQEIWDLDWRQTPAHIIDAGRSRDEVLTEVKSLIWSET